VDCTSSKIPAPLSEGILGMAFSDLSGHHSFATMLNSMFALQMCELGGVLYIGALDPTSYTSGPNYVPITAESPSQSHYTIAITQLSLASTIISTSLGVSIVDSGTTNIQVPQAAYTSFTNMLSENVAFSAAFPGLLSNPGSCVTTSMTTAQLNAQLPSMTWTIGGEQYTLIPINSYLREMKTSSDTYYCLSISAASSSDAVQTILGWGFMNQFVVVFDQPNNRVGFAPAPVCRTTASGSHLSPQLLQVVVMLAISALIWF